MAHFSDAFAIIKRPGKLQNIEDLMPIIRRKPADLSELCRITKFSRKELKTLYHGYKQECPDGCVDLKQFTKMFAQLFPGDVTQYARFVFNTFEKHDDEYIGFKEYVLMLSVLSRGTLEEKLEWIFRLYDIENRGTLDAEQMFVLIRSIFGLLSKSPLIVDQATLVDRKMTINPNDGSIRKEDFIRHFSNDISLQQQLEFLNTQLVKE